jgi:hypothetical protein
VQQRFAFLAGLLFLLLAPPARALPTQNAYEALMAGAWVGTLSFTFDRPVAFGCRYVASWSFGAGVPAEQCAVDETSTLGRGGCFLDALMPVPSLVLAAAGEPCWGFDASGEDTSVFNLVLVERLNGTLDGLVQFDSANAAISAFHAAPRGF